MISGVILDGKNRKPTLQSISGKCSKVSFKFRNLITRRDEYLSLRVALCIYQQYLVQEMLPIKIRDITIWYKL